MDTWILIQCALRQQPWGFTHTHTLLHVYPDLAFNKYLNLPHFQILSLRPHSYIWVLFNHLHPPQPSLHHPSILHFLLFPLLPSSIIPSRSPHPSTPPSSSSFFFPFVSLYRAHLFMHHMTCKAREQAHTDRHICTKCHFHILCLRQWNANHVSVYMESEI